MRKRKFLVVDDDEAERSPLAGALRTAGYEVVVEAIATDAVGKVLEPL